MLESTDQKGGEICQNALSEPSSSERTIIQQDQMTCNSIRVEQNQLGTPSTNQPIQSLNTNKSSHNSQSNFVNQEQIQATYQNIGDAPFKQLIQQNELVFESQKQKPSLLQQRCLFSLINCTTQNLRKPDSMAEVKDLQKKIKWQTNQFNHNHNKYLYQQVPNDSPRQEQAEEDGDQQIKAEQRDFEEQKQIPDKDPDQLYSFGSILQVGEELTVQKALEKYPVRFQREYPDDYYVKACHGSKMLLSPNLDPDEFLPKTDEFILFQLQTRGSIRITCVMMCTFNSDCNMSFYSWKTLFNHLRVHTGEKPFVCSIQGCPKKFTQKGNKIKHEQKHLKSLKRKNRAKMRAEAKKLQASQKDQAESHDME